MLKKWLFRVSGAVSRARRPILLMALTYLLALLAGIAMATTHNRIALHYRDGLISRARARSQVLTSLRSGHRLQAALLDFGGNLGLGAVPQTIGGLGVALPFPIAAFRGWVGGIVSVNDRYESRLAEPRGAVYYLAVILLQLIPYSLAGGAGVGLGLHFYRTRGDPDVRKWWILPRDAVLDVLWIYSAAVPLFLLASLIEFFAA